MLPERVVARRINVLRLFLEIIAAIAIAETLVMFLLPVVAPGLNEVSEAFLDAGMLSLIAGPVILWRVKAATRVAPTVPDSGAVRGTSLAVVGMAVIGVSITAMATYLASYEMSRDAKAQFDRLAERLSGEAVRRVTMPAYGLKGARGAFAGPLLKGGQ